MNHHLWTVSGFMGLSSDWNLFGFAEQQCVEIGSFGWNSLEEWSSRLNEKISGTPGKHILMGYSLGGRLALHAITKTPALWRGAIIISAHPGLLSQPEKLERLKLDDHWAARFENEDWDKLMLDWNSREVFASGKHHFKREEKNYHRLQLAHTLRCGSLGKQSDLRNEISQLNIPILWLVGSQDKKFLDLAPSLSFKHPFSKIIVFEECGHRLPWEQPQIFCQLVTEFRTHVF